MDNDLMTRDDPIGSVHLDMSVLLQHVLSPDKNVKL